ncbi:MAG: hypothetical protein ACPL0A_03960, partial [Candidatus Micrarchaeia archaeon]
MQQVVKKDAMDEYVERLKRYDKLSAEEKKALYNQIVEHIRGLDAQGKGEHVMEALEKLMIFLDNYTTKKSMDENGIIYDSLANTAGRIFLEFPNASIAVIMNAANKKSFVNYTIGAGLVMRAIYEEGDENTKDLIKSAIVTMMSGENLFAK